MTRAVAPTPDAAEHLRGLVAARSVADREGIALESVPLDEAAQRGPGADDVTGRVEEALASALDRLRPDEIGDPREYRRALATLLAQVHRTARKLDDDPGAPLSGDDAHTLEMVVLADGSRPTLLVRDGAVDPEHPLVGRWKDQLTGTRDVLRPHCDAVGRVEPRSATAHDYFGTGWMVDADAGLVLTNWHVVHAMYRRLSAAMVRTETGFRVHDGAAFIDFAAESGSLRTNRFRVVEAVTTPDTGEAFALLDAAVLRIEPTTDAAPEPPGPIPVLADPDGPIGRFASFCTIGFPAPPTFTSGLHDGVDWTWVNTTLFGGRYGVKRLAAGTVHEPMGAFAGDDRPWVFGHDATTLGGSSGSPILNWLDPAPGGFGLHFAGSMERNFAHAVSEAAAELRALGVPV